MEADKRNLATDILGGIANTLSGESKPSITINTQVEIDRESIFALGMMLLAVFTLIIFIWAVARKLSR